MVNFLVVNLLGINLLGTTLLVAILQEATLLATSKDHPETTTKVNLPAVVRLGASRHLVSPVIHSTAHREVTIHRL